MPDGDHKGGIERMNAQDLLNLDAWATVSDLLLSGTSEITRGQIDTLRKAGLLSGGTQK